MKFQDRLVQAGIEGGAEAASGLHQSVESHLRDGVNYTNDTKIIVRIYCNARGLATTYRRAGITTADTFADFMSSFNAHRRMVEIIDAGEDGQAADNEIIG